MQLIKLSTPPAHTPIEPPAQLEEGTAGHTSTDVDPFASVSSRRCSEPYTSKNLVRTFAVSVTPLPNTVSVLPAAMFSASCTLKDVPSVILGTPRDTTFLSCDNVVTSSVVGAMVTVGASVGTAVTVGDGVVGTGVGALAAVGVGVISVSMRRRSSAREPISKNQALGPRIPVKLSSAARCHDDGACAGGHCRALQAVAKNKRRTGMIAPTDRQLEVDEQLRACSCASRMSATRSLRVCVCRAADRAPCDSESDRRLREAPNTSIRTAPGGGRSSG